MRTRLLLIFAFIMYLNSFETFGQSIIENLKNKFENELSTYCLSNNNNKSQKILSVRVFKTQMRNIFNNMVIGNGDATSSGSAFAFSNDKFKNTFTLNGNIFVSKKSNQILDLGLNLTSKDNTYYYYTNNSWVNDIGLKVGFSKTFLSQTQYINEISDDGSELKCDDLKTKRLAYIIDKFIKYDSIYTNRVQIIARIDALTKILSSNDNLKFEVDKPKTNLFKELKKLKKQKDILDNKLVENNLDKLVENDIDEFDKGGNYFLGHKIYWWNSTINFTNSSIKIDNQTIIDENIQKKFKSYIKISLEGSFNIQRDKKHFVETSQIYAKFNRGSYLDNPILKGKKFSMVATSDLLGYDVIDDSGILIDDYNSIQNPYITGDIGGYYSNVFALKKTIGLIGKFNYNYPIKNNTMKEYYNNYSASMGIIFRVNTKDKWSSATVILNTGFDNVTFHEGADDKFFVKISAGIPFNVFSNKEK